MKRSFRSLYNIIFLLTGILVVFSQEEPEAKFLENKYDFVDSIPFVLVNADKPQWSISKYLNGSHFVYAFENDSLYSDNRIAKWMQKSNTNIVRWPGGTVVQYYHWDKLTGIPFKDDSWAPGYDSKDEPDYRFMDLDEYIAFCRKANTEPLIGINIRSGKEYNRKSESLEEAKRLITYCKEKNYNVKRWYIGNEGYAKGFSAEKYAAYIDLYAQVLKSVDPDIEIIGDWKIGPFKKNRFEQTLYIAKTSKELDVMELHEKWGNPWGLKSGYSIEAWRNEFPLYDGNLGVFIRRFKEEMKRENKEIKIGFNEWGIGKIKDATEFDYALIAADFLIQLYKNDVYQACYWNLNMGEEKSKILKTDKSGTQLLDFNPIATIFTLFSDAQAKHYLHLDCNERFIYGFGAKNTADDTIYLYLLNKSEKNEFFNLGLFGLKENTVDITIQSFIKPGIINSNSLKTTDPNNTKLELPSFSFNKIIISKMPKS